MTTSAPLSPATAPDDAGPDGGSRLILVTGASGYVGGRLVPKLLDAGHRVRTTRRDQSKDQPWWSERVETVTMDVNDADQVRAACEGVDVVYYLVHGMGGDDFMEKDREAARIMRDAADEAGVERIVYLSGLIPEEAPREELSDHLASRLEVEEILSQAQAGVITLRAAVLMGSGSTSFEVIRQISERMPLQTVPTWMDHLVQPIAIVDALEALVASADVDSPTRSYDIGGPEQLRYPELLSRYAELAGLTRPQVDVPLLPTKLVSVLAGRMTDVPAPVVEALLDSLHHDMVCQEQDFVRDLLPEGYELMGLDESIRRSLADPRETEPADPDAADPMGPMPHDPSWAGGGDQSLLQRAAETARDVLPGRD